MLSPEKQTEILSLYFAQKMKIRAIARKLGVDRKSVKQVVDRRSVALEIQPSNRVSCLTPFKDHILDLIKDDPDTTAKVVLQRIRDQGYDGGYTILTDWLRTQRAALYPKKKLF